MTRQYKLAKPVIKLFSKGAFSEIWWHMKGRLAMNGTYAKTKPEIWPPLLHLILRKREATSVEKKKF